MPTKTVYDHIEQKWVHESSEPVIRELMTEYAEKLHEQNAERTFWFDLSRTSADRKIVVTPLSEDVLVGMHKHDYYEFNLVLAGTLYDYIEDQCYSIHQNEFVLLHPDVFHLSARQLRRLQHFGGQNLLCRPQKRLVRVLAVGLACRRG